MTEIDCFRRKRTLSDSIVLQNGVFQDANLLFNIHYSIIRVTAGVYAESTNISPDEFDDIVTYRIIETNLLGKSFYCNYYLCFFRLGLPFSLINL